MMGVVWPRIELTLNRLYKTATEARWAVDQEAYSKGKQPHPHTYLGGICDEAECYCGIQMPLDENGDPKLTLEGWMEYHDEVLMKSLENDELEDSIDE